MKTTLEKIEYLRRLLNLYLKFHRHYTEVDLKVSNKDIMVIWSKPRDEWFDFEDVTFPIVDINARIANYKYKVNKYFKRRNERIHIRNNK